MKLENLLQIILIDIFKVLCKIEDCFYHSLLVRDRDINKLLVLLKKATNIFLSDF